MKARKLIVGSVSSLLAVIGTSTMVFATVGLIERFDATGVGLSAWIFGICRHVIADRYRAVERLWQGRLHHLAPLTRPSTSQLQRNVGRYGP